MDQLNTNLILNTANTPLSTLRTSTPFPLPISDLSSQFPLLIVYHLAIDPIAYIITSILSQGDTFISELTNLLNYTDQTNSNYRSLQTLYQDSVLELDSLCLVNSDLQAQLRTTISQRDNVTSQRDKLISTLSQPNPIQPRSAEHPDPRPFSGDNPTDLSVFLSSLALKLRTNDDWYPTLQTRIAYTYSRLEGKAAG